MSAKNFKFSLFIIFFLFDIYSSEITDFIRITKCTVNSSNVPPILNITSHLVYNEESNLTFRLQNYKTKYWCSEGGTLKNFKLNKNHEPFVIVINNGIRNLAPTSSEIGLPGGHIGWIATNSTDVESSNLEPLYFLTDGTLRLGIHYFSTDEYCINEYSKDEISIDVCIPNCDKFELSRPCIKKCCSVGTVLDIGEEKCSSSGNKTWNPQFYKNPFISNPENKKWISQPHFVISQFSCESSFENDTENHVPFQYFSSAQLSPEDVPVAWKMTLDGQIWWNKPNKGWIKLHTEQYCIDGILNFGEGKEFRGLPSDQALVFCSSDHLVTSGRYAVLYVTVMFISAAFLFLTASVYFLLWELQNVHGWTILSHVISMFFMYVFLALAHLYGLNKMSDEGGGACTVIGVIAHFFFLSTFCWLTIINFDLCWTFRFLSPGSVGRSRGLKRYILYLIFALLVPSTVICVGLTLEKIYGDDIESEVVLPRYGIALCYVAVSAQGVYIYYIVGTLLASNFILIFITLVTIYKFKQNTKVVLNNRTSPNSSFLLFVKLFIVMGITWIFEMISWVDMNTKATDELPWYWIIFDLINILQAIAIFIIFVCKTRILNQLKGKYVFIARIISTFSKDNASRVGANGNQVEAEMEPRTAHSSLAPTSKKSDAETKI